MAIWGALIGAGASLLGTTAQIGLGINELRQNKIALDQAQKSLAFAKEQYADQKKNYDGYMQDTQESASAYNTNMRKDKDKITNNAPNTQPLTKDLPMDRL